MGELATPASTARTLEGERKSRWACVNGVRVKESTTPAAGSVLG